MYKLNHGQILNIKLAPWTFFSFPLRRLGSETLLDINLYPEVIARPEHRRMRLPAFALSSVNS